MLLRGAAELLAQLTKSGRRVAARSEELQQLDRTRSRLHLADATAFGLEEVVSLAFRRRCSNRHSHLRRLGFDMINRIPTQLSIHR